MRINLINKTRMSFTLKILAYACVASIIPVQAFAASEQTLPEVTASKPLSLPLKEWDDYVGRFVASQSVDIRPQVSGQITEKNFNDGDIVKKGQVLFVIDQRPFIAALTAARAEEAKAESALILARSDLTRAQRLTGDESLSAGEIDALKAQVRSAQAQKAMTKAITEQKSLDVEWATVRAPITGRVSNRRVDIGNLVMGGNGNNATLLTTINAQDPIYFTFDASESLFLKSQRLNITRNNQTEVQVRLQDEREYAHKGTLDFVDNGLDPHSGTIRLRATFPNSDGFLTPGMFGNMRMAVSDEKNVLMVPDAAIQTSQTRKSVLVVAKDNTLVAKPITTGALIDGMRVIKSGISQDDNVVTAGMQMVAPGIKVSVEQKALSPSIISRPARKDSALASSDKSVSSKSSK